MSDHLWVDEQLAQSVLRLLTQKPLTTEEVATAIGLDNVQALVLLRDIMKGRVAEVTTTGDNARMWVAAEIPLA